MSPIVYAIPIFLSTIVIEIVVAHFRGRQVYDTSDAVASLHFGIISQVFNTFTKLFTIGIYIAVYEAFAALAWPMDSVVLWVLAVVLYDFCYYWNHRLNHEIALLWGGHVVHHSSEYFNLSTALRQSSTSAFYNWMFYLPLAVLGVPPTMFAVVALIDLLYQYWVHTELIDRMGWFEWIFVTPSNHRVHHGQNDYCIDRNYGGIFIVWDRLFGTFADERRDEKVCYGVRKPVASLNPLWGNLHYYVELWREACEAENWRAGLRVCLAPPGGWSNEALPHFEAARFARFDSQAPLALRCYVSAHCVTLILLLGAFLAIYGTQGATGAAPCGVFIVVTAVSLCGLLERLRWAKWLEQTRLAAIAVVMMAQPGWLIAPLPLAARLTVAFAALVCLLWLATQDVTVTDEARAAGVNADAFSDLVLAVICALVFFRRIRDMPGLAIPALLVGIAACFGVLRFSGVAVVLGPHRYASLFAACAAFPLLAYALRFPDDPIARRLTAASRFAFLLGGIGVAAVVLGAGKWGDVAAALSALVILWTMLFARDSLRLFGALALIAGFVVTLAFAPDAHFGFLTPVQGLHYLLCLAFVALILPRRPHPAL